jgi:heme-binding NEAT domain protein
MAKKELPKAQLAGIVKGIVKGYQGAKAGVKLASQIKKRAKNIKAIGVTKKADAVVEAEKKAARLQKAADTRAANKAANAAKNPKPGTPKPGTKKPATPKPATPKPATPKGKEPFVKSKARLATENVTGKVIGGFPFYTANAIKKTLKNPIAQGIVGTGTTLYVANRYAKTNAPKKVKKYKKK